MNDVKLGTILENAARLAGRDPASLPVPEGWKVLAGMAIEAGLHALAAEKFPLMQRVEFRRYRPTYSAGVGYEAGQEVWHEGAYWRVESEKLKVESGGGGVEGMRRLQPGEVARFIAFDQPWEQVVMQSFGVDVTRFAYAEDPRYNPEATPIRGCRLCELGVILPGDAPDGVFVKFIPEYPRFAFEDWREGAAYSPGDTAYAAGDVWQYLGYASGGGRTAPDQDANGFWRPLRVRSEFAAYLTRLVAADFLTEDQGKHQTRAAADREFDSLCERYHEGGGETRIRMGRFR